MALPRCAAFLFQGVLPERRLALASSQAYPSELVPLRYRG